MNRRSFFKALGATVAIVVAKPVVPVPVQVPITTMAGTSWIDMANAYAFGFVAEVLPEHRDHYRLKALNAARRVIAAQQYRRV